MTKLFYSGPKSMKFWRRIDRNESETGIYGSALFVMATQLREMESHVIRLLAISEKKWKKAKRR